METLTLALGDRGYPIHIGIDILSQLAQELARLNAKGPVAVCTDANVAKIHGERVVELVRSAGLRPVLCVMPAGEEAKQLARVEEFCGMFLEAGLDRSSVVLALGGGVPGDVVGFAAASFMRGVRYIQIPTTIVAQVDSSVGGKTGVNHTLGKNTIGAFHQPSAVIIDLMLLRTLPDRELRAGLAEVIKHGMIADAELFQYMERHVEPILNKNLEALMVPLRRSCEIKADVVANDEKEQGLRAILNYGHTFGHAIEAVTGYGRFLHGEAVALGMHAAAVLAHNLELVGKDLVERQNACIEAYGLPIRWPELPVDETLAAMRHDKKARTGVLKFIVADRIGHAVQRTDISDKQAREALLALT
ncbi:MAG: 3-dehydroquinate synthase [Candidatus Hydrogenedentes bacterium]|nr:3-dehydroquinate synthase [Candidatus Hydrogenedentota bacterium]